MKAIVAIALLCAGQAVVAGQTTLRCSLTFLKDGTQSESWVVIDPDANYMRVDGVSNKLNMSNERYASSQRIGPFIKMTAIDRNTGEIIVSSLYEGQVVLPYKGKCERATPPAAKF